MNLTDAVTVLASKNEMVLATGLLILEKFRLQHPRDLAEVDSIFRERKRVELMNEGLAFSCRKRC